jgi:hypothetical protein
MHALVALHPRLVEAEPRLIEIGLTIVGLWSADALQTAVEAV